MISDSDVKQLKCVRYLGLLHKGHTDIYTRHRYRYNPPPQGDMISVDAITLMRSDKRGHTTAAK